jgi:hypothetical protein
MDDHTLDTAFAVPRRYLHSHVAYLKANPPPKGRTREAWYLYDVIFDGRVIVVDSEDPEHDLARALVAEGITGTVNMLDAITGEPRTIINIENAAKFTVEENRTHGPRLVKWRPMADRLAKLMEGRQT